MSGRRRSLPKITIPEVMPLVEEYMSRNLTGGSLHIVLEDGNIDNDDVLFCKEYAIEQGDLFGIELADILLQMSKTQRKKIYMRSHG